MCRVRARRSLPLRRRAAGECAAVRPRADTGTATVFPSSSRQVSDSQKSLCVCSTPCTVAPSPGAVSPCFEPCTGRVGRRPSLAGRPAPRRPSLRACTPPFSRDADGEPRGRRGRPGGAAGGRCWPRVALPAGLAPAPGPPLSRPGASRSAIGWAPAGGRDLAALSGGSAERPEVLWRAPEAPPSLATAAGRP